MEALMVSSLISCSILCSSWNGHSPPGRLLPCRKESHIPELDPTQMQKAKILDEKSGSVNGGASGWGRWKEVPTLEGKRKARKHGATLGLRSGPSPGDSCLGEGVRRLQQPSFLDFFTSESRASRSLSPKCSNTRVNENTLWHNDPLRFVFQDGKERHFSPFTDKNNLLLILKSLSFVSHRPAAYNGTLWESSLHGPAGPPVLRLPTGGDARRWELQSGRGPRADPALLLDIIQKSPLSGGSPKSKTNRARSSGKCWVLELAGTAFAFPRPEPVALPTCSCNSKQGRGRQGGLGTRARPGLRAGNRHSSLFRQALQSPRPEGWGLFLVPGVQWKNSSQKREKKTFLNCSFRFTNSVHLHSTDEMSSPNTDELAITVSVLEAGTVIPISQMKKARHREVK